MTMTYEECERAAGRAISMWNADLLPPREECDPKFEEKHLDRLIEKLQRVPSLEHLAYHYTHRDGSDISRFQRCRVLEVQGNQSVIGLHCLRVGNWYAIPMGIEKSMGGISLQNFPYIPYNSACKITREVDLLHFEWTAEMQTKIGDNVVKKGETFKATLEIYDVA